MGSLSGLGASVWAPEVDCSGFVGFLGAADADAAADAERVLLSVGGALVVFFGGIQVL